MNSLAGSLIGWLVIPKAKHVSVAFPIVSLTHSEWLGRPPPGGEPGGAVPPPVQHPN